MHHRIEHITEAHIPGFHAALDAVAREKRYLAFTEAPPLDQTRAFVERNLREGNPQFVVLHDEEVVGWCDICRYQQHAMRHTGALGIGLLPAWRGRAIGPELMRMTIETAWQREFTRIELGVRHDNQRALLLYERLGFRHEGRRVAAMCVDGRYEDSLMMALLHPSVNGKTA